METTECEQRFAQANAEIFALQIALKATLTALDDTMPAVRSIVVQTLDEALDKNRNPLYQGSPMVAEAREMALTELSADIETSNKLYEI